MADAGDASSPASAGLVAAGTSESVRPFVGRLRELTELSAVLVGSSAGRGGLFMVTGEPGIGKSRLMEEFARDGMTLVFASHNLGQVKRLASRVIYLEHGRLVADLPVHDFFNGPLPEATRLFVKGELV